MAEPIRIDGNYQTRAGHPVRVLCVDAKGNQPVVALVTEDGVENVRRFNRDGCYYMDGRETPYDIVPGPVRESRWISIANIPDIGFESLEDLLAVMGKDSVPFRVDLEDGKVVNVALEPAEGGGD